jgi:xanthine dehydrogenase accessory factor
MHMDVLRRAHELLGERRRAVMVTVVATAGSTPRKPGARMLVVYGANGPSSIGTIGGGRVEQAVLEAAARVLETEVAELVQHELTAELAMCCGGRMTFFVEPLVSPPPLIVFGLGHVGAAVVRAAAPLGFAVVGVDDLPENLDPKRLAEATRLVDSYEPGDLTDLPFGDDTFVVIATREHQLDQKLLELCVPRAWCYLGVIGSRRKAAMQKERLLAKGLARERIDQVRCPMGVDIGAHTPEEIAVSVCAELVSIRRGGPRFAR